MLHYVKTYRRIGWIWLWEIAATTQTEDIILTFMAEKETLPIVSRVATLATLFN